MGMGATSEAKSFSASQISRILWAFRIPYPAHKSPQLSLSAPE